MPNKYMPTGKVPTMRRVDAIESSPIGNIEIIRTILPEIREIIENIQSDTMETLDGFQRRHRRAAEIRKALRDFRDTSQNETTKREFSTPILLVEDLLDEAITRYVKSGIGIFHQKGIKTNRYPGPGNIWERRNQVALHGGKFDSQGVSVTVSHVPKNFVEPFHIHEENEERGLALDRIAIMVEETRKQIKQKFARLLEPGQMGVFSPNVIHTVFNPTEQTSRIAIVKGQNASVDRIAFNIRRELPDLNRTPLLDNTVTGVKIIKPKGGDGSLKHQIDTPHFSYVSEIARVPITESVESKNDKYKLMLVLEGTVAVRCDVRGDHQEITVGPNDWIVIAPDVREYSIVSDPQDPARIYQVHEV